MFKCEICGKELQIKGVSSHLRHKHNISVKDYYDKYLKKEGEGFCKTCGKPTSFLSISKGYKKHCNPSCANKNLDSIRKSKETKKERYGNENYNNREKAKCTCLKRYGVEHNWSSKNDKLNGRTTRLEKYGDKNFINIPKREQTTLKKYGVKHHMQSSKIKSKFNYEDIVNKLNETKKKNGTFNTSSKEERAYNFLLEYFSKVERQYKEKRYPFHCDFYLLDYDIFIECNFHWTHGEHWFDENSKDDIEILNIWKEKAKNSKFYANAIYAWTVRDIEKREIARKNNLKYKVFWNLEELKIWVKGENYATFQL